MSKDVSGRVAPPPGMRGGFAPPPGMEHLDPRAFEQYAAKYFRMHQQQQRGGAGPSPFHPGFPGQAPFSMGLMGPPPGMPMMLPPGPPPPGFPFPPYPPGVFPPGYFGPSGPPPPGLGGPQSSPRRSPAQRGVPLGQRTPPQMKFMPDTMHRSHSGLSGRPHMGRVDTELSRNPAAENNLSRQSYPNSPRQRSKSPKRKQPEDSPVRLPVRQPEGGALLRSGSHELRQPNAGVLKRDSHETSPPHANGQFRSEQRADADENNHGCEPKNPDRVDEREVKRLKRKQSNRESARRSRLRKQAECEDLTGRIQHLQHINSQLRLEFVSLAGSREELIRRASILEDKLNRLNEGME